MSKFINDLKWVAIVLVAITGTSSETWIIQFISGGCIALIGLKLAKLRSDQ